MAKAVTDFFLKGNSGRKVNVDADWTWFVVKEGGNEEGEDDAVE